MARSTQRALLRKAATDGVKHLDQYVEKLYAAARNFADPGTVFEQTEAKRLLVDAAYYLCWAAGQSVRGGLRNGQLIQPEPPAPEQTSPATEDK